MVPRPRDAPTPPLPLTALALVFHALNTGAAVYRGRRDARAVASTLAPSLALALLLLCVRLLEGTPPAGASRRRRLRAAVWLLSAALTVAFARRFAAAVPPSGAALVWAMSAATVSVGFYALVVAVGHRGGGVIVVAAEDEAPGCLATQRHNNTRQGNTMPAMGD
ncbi:uncharacterized protein LOC121053309 [Oryza brachyantha]|uniref:uncharacterized protein LOC121053309 n=1 Tax=Oryza brachyantha TaxID=4533 RepID=UPI001AD9C74A|nr:uncharacterized protein LOC121053309 [Oryza brachyantha]